MGQPRQQAVLGILAMRANRVISRGELVDAVWGQDPPASAEGGIYTYVAGLRRVIEPARSVRGPGRVLVSSGAGYVLHLVPGQPDAVAFEQQLARARQLRKNGDPVAAVDALEGALGLWRGVAFAGVPGPFAETERVRLAELRSGAAEERADVLLALGRHEEVVPDLTVLVADHPLRERMRGLLMIALYRGGRHAEALRVFADGRHVLAEELGIDPGTELSRIHQQVLTCDPALNLAGGPAADGLPDPAGGSARPRPKAAGTGPRGSDGSVLPSETSGPAGPVLLPGAGPGIGPGVGRAPSWAASRRSRPGPVAAGRSGLLRPPRRAPRAARHAAVGPGRRDGRVGAGGDHLGDGRGGQDRAGHPLRAPGGQALPGRSAVRQPARAGSGPAADGTDGSTGAPADRLRHAAAPADVQYRGTDGPVPQPGRRQAHPGRARQREQRGSGAAAAARLAGLPGRGDQPQPDGRAGGRGGGHAHLPRRARRRRSPRDAGPQARPGARRGRAAGGGRDHQGVRRPPAGPVHRGRARDGGPGQAAAGAAGGRTARRPEPAGRTGGRRRGDRRAGRAFVVLRPAQPGRRADVPPARPAPGPGRLPVGGGQPGRDLPGRGGHRAARAHPDPHGRRAPARPVHLP